MYGYVTRWEEQCTTILPVLGIRNEDVCTYKYDQGERRCGTGIHGVRSGVEGAMRSYARGFDSLMIRLDLNTIRRDLEKKRRRVWSDVRWLTCTYF